MTLALHAFNSQKEDGHFGHPLFCIQKTTQWNRKYRIAFAPKYRRKVFYKDNEQLSEKYCSNYASGKE